MRIEPNIIKVKEWELYESEVLDKLKKEFPNDEIKKNIRKLGKYSRVNRQIDIAVYKETVGYNMLGIIDCKCFNRKLNVRDIESFIGLMEDVAANFGIIISNIGYSKAAKNRAEMKEIKLEVVDFLTFTSEDYHYDLDICRLCNPRKEKPLGIIHFYPYGRIEDGIVTIFDIGRCDRCSGLHIRCQNCGTITGITENLYGKIIECEGNCGLRVMVKQNYIGEGMYEEEIILVDKD